MLPFDFFDRFHYFLKSAMNTNVIDCSLKIAEYTKTKYHET